MSEGWVQCWGQSHAALSFFYYPSCKKTYRLVLNTAISGEQIRVRLSGKCQKNDVEIGALTASRCDADGTFIGEPVKLTFGGKSSFTLKKGITAVSDSAPLSVNAGEYVALSLYVKEGSLTSGNLLSNVNIITAKGDRTADRELPNEPRVRDSVRSLACKVLGMFLHKPIPLFDSVELLNTDGAKSIVIFGDSLSQQGFWTNAFDERIRASFPGRYSVINKSIMGNRVLLDYSTKFFCRGLFGQRGTERIKDDVYAYDNVDHVILALGVNDVLQYGTITTYKKEKPDPKELCAAIKQLTFDIKARGTKVMVMTLIGFADFPDYKPDKEELRHQVNTWLRENKDLFDGFFDLAKLSGVPGKEGYTVLSYLGPDKLHPNLEGGKFFADSIDLSMFGEAACVSE